MSETITVSGLVATTPRHLVTQDGLPITSFRLASSQRRFDRSQNRWIDGDTNWYTVTGFRQLAINAAGSISKGDRILVGGKLRVRDWDNGERAGTSVEIEADSLGHDLTWGSSVFTRTVLVREADPADEPESEEESTDEDVAEPKQKKLAKASA
ncbi:MAG: single-stranded DNA-binding protein [Actinomycetes bacterium]